MCGYDSSFTKQMDSLMIHSASPTNVELQFVKAMKMAVNVEVRTSTVNGRAVVVLLSNYDLSIEW